MNQRKKVNTDYHFSGYWTYVDLILTHHQIILTPFDPINKLTWLIFWRGADGISHRHSHHRVIPVLVTVTNQFQDLIIRRMVRMAQGTVHFLSQKLIEFKNEIFWEKEFLYQNWSIYRCNFERLRDDMTALFNRILCNWTHKSATNSISSTRVPYTYSTPSQAYSSRNYSSRISTGTGTSYASELRNSSRPSSGSRTNYSYTPSNSYGSSASLRNAYSRWVSVEPWQP